MVKPEVVVVGEPTWNLRDPPQGSKAYLCTLCNTDVWISRDSQSIVESGARVECRPCALKRMSDSDKVEIAPGALNTLSKHLRRRVTREEVDRYIVRMRRAD